jgi:hypothetical protein
MITYLGNILEVFMALLVDSCFLQISSNSNVLPQENFTMVCQPVKNLNYDNKIYSFQETVILIFF